MKKLKVLLFGASGFLGKNITTQASHTGIDLTLVHRQGNRVGGFYPERYINVLSEDAYIRTRLIIDEIKPDIVINATAYGVATKIEKAVSDRVNIDWPVFLARICDGSSVNSFIHFGSCAEYGNLSFEPEETIDIKPASPYGISKASGTTALLATNINSLNLIILRLYPLFGPYEQPNKLFPVIIKALLTKEQAYLGDPMKIRNYSYSKDIAEIVLKLGELSMRKKLPKIINVGSSKNLSLLDWSEHFINSMDVPFNPGLLNWNALPPSPTDPYFMAPNLKLLKSLLDIDLDINTNAYSNTIDYWKGKKIVKS
jgi:dolichol-phosphate mannosyltransferase